MEDTLTKDLLSVGIQAASMLSTDEDNFLVYEHVGNYLYNELSKLNQIYLINLYVIDERGEFFQQEVTCDQYGLMQGYDVIPVEHFIDLSITTEEIKTESNELIYTTIPLAYKNKAIGILELHSHDLTETFIEGLKKLCTALALGVNNRLLTIGNLLQKQSIDMITDVTKSLNIITEVDDLILSFSRTIVNYMLFDRVTIFLYGDKNEIISGRCIDYKGQELSVKYFPQLPDIDDKPTLLSGLSGCWFPLSTSTKKVGVVLFDNIYSSGPFPEWNNDILLTLCNQFAIAVENIYLFKRVQHTARRDKLTNLYNRAYLEEMMDELSSHMPVSIIIGDVNGLKVTNDVFGHLEGDKILLEISNILQSICAQDAIIARWGGDEFLAILPNTGNEAAGITCNNIQNACEKETSHVIPISITLGYETRVTDKDDMVTVLKKAEDMMYYNKQIEREQFNANFVESIKSRLINHCDEGKAHIDALMNLAFKFGIILGLSEYERKNLNTLCLFHDIGKIVIDEDILKTDRELTSQEWEIITKHSTMGSRIAHTFPELKLIEDEILCHHEHWDGTGYPNGKRTLEIPKLSRIFAIFDAYAVMTQGRPYQKAYTHEAAIKEIEAKAGIQFDPSLARLFVKSFKDGIGY